MTHYEKVLTCSPGKGITTADGRTLDELLTQWIAEVDELRGVRRRAYRLRSLAEMCRQHQRWHTALQLLNRALDECLDDDHAHGTTRHASVAQQIGAEVDALWHEIRPDEQRSSLETWVRRHYVEHYYEVLLSDEAMWEAYTSVDPVPSEIYVKAGPRPS